MRAEHSILYLIIRSNNRRERSERVIVSNTRVSNEMVCCVRQIVLANVMILIEPWANGKTKKGAFGGFWQNLLLVQYILSLVDEKSNYFNVKNNKFIF